jgi:hypothetical protein
VYDCNRYATTIISGICGGTTGCLGEDVPDRIRSATTFGSSVSGAMRATGWALQLLD